MAGLWTNGTGMTTSAHDVVLISDFNLDLLKRFLSQIEEETDQGRVHLAPYGQWRQALMEKAGWRDAAPSPDLFVWVQPHAACPSFARLLYSEDMAPGDIEMEVDAFCELLLSIKDTARSLLVPSWMRPASHRGAGLLDFRLPGGLSRALLEMNTRLARNLERAGNAYVLDANQWLHWSDGDPHDPRAWFFTKSPFAPGVYRRAAAAVKAARDTLRGASKKLLIVDLDETIWGGIVGEIGWEKLQVGGHNPSGEAYQEFQRTIKALNRRGVLLAIASKNDPKNVEDAFEHHPEMILRTSDFAARRINWRDKAQNIVEIVDELGLGLDSAVFLDDNPAERARVREALPDVYVPDLPDDKMRYAGFLLSLACFDTPAITQEDRERTAMYAQAHARTKTRGAMSSIQEWVRSLNTRLNIDRLNAANLVRAVQLLNKTNQMNLTTRRMSESELLAWTAVPGNAFFTVRARDRFGDLGLVGLLGMTSSGPVALVTDFVLSCRVLGRLIEETLLAWTIVQAKTEGTGYVEAVLTETPRNGPCRDFFLHSGMEMIAPHRFRWATSRLMPFPDGIAVEFEP